MKRKLHKKGYYTQLRKLRSKVFATCNHNDFNRIIKKNAPKKYGFRKIRSSWKIRNLILWMIDNRRIKINPNEMLGYKGGECASKKS